MKPEYPLPVRYVLYTHYHEANDWKNMTRETSLLIVQVVRSFEQGTLRTDLNYDA